MFQRLCTIFLSLFLLSACGKYVAQTPLSEDSNASLDGLWLATNAEQKNDVLPSLVFLPHGRIAFVYPIEKDSNTAQAKKVHTTIPLAWQSQGQELSITSLDISPKKSPHNANNSGTLTQLFSYALNMEQSQAASLVLTPINQASHGGQNMSYTQDKDAIGFIQGSLFYRERMMLPPDATAIILLEDTSRADAPSIVLSSIGLNEAQHTPLAFQIPYIKADIHRGNKYNLRACIISDGSLLFSTTNAYPVLRRPQDTRPVSVDLLLHRVHSDNALQENAYSTSLQNTYWALQSLRGEPITHFEGQPEPHLILSSDGKSAGSDGCNNFFGTFTSYKQRITLFPGGNTMMMCPQGDKQAAIFMSSLQEATAYTITDKTLELLRGKDVIARFIAKPLP